MHRFKHFLRDVFGFSGTEIRGVWVLLLLMVALIFAPFLYRTLLESSSSGFTQRDKQKLDSMVKTLENLQKTAKNAENTRLFAFDPNRLSKDSLKLLGFSDEIAGRIVHYREAGGNFEEKKDLLTIYDLPQAQFERVKDSILIFRQNIPSENTPKKAENHPKTAQNTRFSGQNTSVDNAGEVSSPTKKYDLNQADSLQLQKIYGIGPAYAARIIKYRSLLGGYVRMHQLHEVYGLPPDVIDKLKKRYFITEKFAPRQLHLNRDSLTQILKHPYIKYEQALQIVRFRKDYGSFQATDDLLEVGAVDSALFIKIAPYLTTTAD